MGIFTMPNYRNRYFLALIVFSVFSSLAMGLEYSLYDAGSGRKCSSRRCLSIDEIITRSKKNSYGSRKQVETLFRSRQSIKMKISRLLPSLNISLLGSGLIQDYTVLPSLVGFLFPSNWFRWKESKLFYLAERESFISLLANQVIESQELYYYLHQEMIDAEIYKHHYEQMGVLIEYFKKNLPEGESTDFKISRIQALESQSKIKSMVLNNDFKDTLPLLAHIIALDVEEDWDSNSIQYIPLPKLENMEDMDFRPYYVDTIEKSHEVKALKYLQIASKYSRKSRVFEFLSPLGGTDNSLGYGYLSSLKIEKSNLKTLQIKEEETCSLLKVNIHAQVLNHNASKLAYLESLKGRQSAMTQLSTVLKNLEEKKELDIDKLTEALYLAVNFDLQKNQAQHYYMVSLAKIKRLLWEGDNYKNLEQEVPQNQKTKWYKKLTKSLGKRIL